MSVNIQNNSPPHPTRTTVLSSGYDLKANINSPLYCDTLETVVIPTGIKLQMDTVQSNQSTNGDHHYEFQIRPRSSVSMKGILVHAGTVDLDYTGEIKIILTNVSKTIICIEPKQRIAQLVCAEIHSIKWNTVREHFNQTERGERGFGSSGKN